MNLKLVVYVMMLVLDIILVYLHVKHVKDFFVVIQKNQQFSNHVRYDVVLIKIIVIIARHVGLINANVLVRKITTKKQRNSFKFSRYGFG
jgi:hypothetical protein